MYSNIKWQISTMQKLQLLLHQPNISFILSILFFFLYLTLKFSVTVLQKEWLPTPVFLPGEFHEQRSLTGYSPWGHKETDTTE